MLDEIRARIEACLGLPGMNKTLLAHLAGVHRNTLEGIEEPGWNPAVKTLERIMRVVDGITELAQ
jgi:DNA-binding XRE family transcriptional regulator